MIGDIVHVCVMCQVHDIDHGDTTLDSCGNVHDIRAKCQIPRVNINIEDIEKI